MKLNIKASVLFAVLAVTLVGCKRDKVISPDFADAYTRIIMIDAPGNGKSQFYLDNKVNANGDSLIHNPDGSLYQPDANQNSTTLINYPSGGWTDNSPLNFAGTYGFNNKPGSTYSTFPNPTGRIALAPIINNYNYYNWAALPAAQHLLSFYSVINSSVFGNPISIRGDKFFEQSVSLEGGSIQTFLLINKAVAKQYTTEQNTNTGSPLPIYEVDEQINHFSNQFGLITIKDHPGKLPNFKDSSAYIRFINVSPAFTDQALNQSTATLDIYIAPIYGLRPDMVYNGIFGPQYYKRTDSVGAEIQVAKGLNRFESVTDAPFYELNVAANMRINKKTGKPDTVTVAGRPRVPRYYRVLAYRPEQSAARGNQPVAKGDWLAVFNRFPAEDVQNGGAGGDWVDSWLLRSDGTNFHPAVCTIPIAVDANIFLGPDAVGDAHYLGFRSVINYQRAGINNVFFQNNGAKK